MLVWILVQVLVTISLTRTNALLTRRLCTTSTGRPGVCVTLVECPSLFKSLHTRVNIRQVPVAVAQHNECLFSGFVGISYVCCANLASPLLPSPGECGVPAWISNRITSGDVAGLGEFPWSTLLINEKQRGRDALFCGGVLISKLYVVTAAHCVKDLHQRWISVRLGEHAIDTEIDCIGTTCNEPPLDVPVEELISHPKFNSTTFENDIALLRLANPVNFTNYIKPLCLPSNQNTDTSGIVFDFAGWGQTAQNAPKSNVKQKITLRGVTYDYCRAKYNETNPPRQIYDSQLCALGEFGRDSCRGDSGNALVGYVAPKGEIPHYYLAGISSYGVNKCGTDGWPGVYTRVTKYVDWIKENLKIKLS